MALLASWLLESSLSLAAREITSHGLDIQASAALRTSALGPTGTSKIRSSHQLRFNSSAVALLLARVILTVQSSPLRNANNFERLASQNSRVDASSRPRPRRQASALRALVLVHTAVHRYNGREFPAATTTNILTSEDSTVPPWVCETSSARYSPLGKVIIRIPPSVDQRRRKGGEKRINRDPPYSHQYVYLWPNLTWDIHHGLSVSRPSGPCISRTVPECAPCRHNIARSWFDAICPGPCAGGPPNCTAPAYPYK